MNLCDDHHQEVCYECRKCPVCEAVKVYEQAHKDCMTKHQECEDLKAQIAELTKEPLINKIRKVTQNP